MDATKQAILELLQQVAIKNGATYTNVSGSIAEMRVGNAALSVNAAKYWMYPQVTATANSDYVRILDLWVSITEAASRLDVVNGLKSVGLKAPTPA